MCKKETNLALSRQRISLTATKGVRCVKPKTLNNFQQLIKVKVRPGTACPAGRRGVVNTADVRPAIGRCGDYMTARYREKWRVCVSGGGAPWIGGRCREGVPVCIHTIVTQYCFINLNRFQFSSKITFKKTQMLRKNVQYGMVGLRKVQEEKKSRKKVLQNFCLYLVQYFILSKKVAINI